MILRPGQTIADTLNIGFETSLNQDTRMEASHPQSRGIASGEEE